MADKGDPVRPKKVLVMVPRRAELEQRIHGLAINTSNITWTNHFLDRAEERDFTTLDALRILRGGYLSDDIVPGKSTGEWKCKLVMKLKGRREAGVVVIVVNSSGLLVKTIEWEDWKGQ
jgi:hypothetical protein